MPRNPFEQLYVSEQVQPTEFVDIFSSVLVPHAMPLFQPGHVVLSGVQGSGKTMLFKLLEADVRVAYAKARRRFPLPRDIARFIGAKINVNTSRAKNFGSRRVDPDSGISELMFGDFLNYYVAIDMIGSVRTLQQSHTVASDLGIDGSPKVWEEFSRCVARDDIWEGFLDNVNGIDELLDRMAARLHAYRRYINANDPMLNDEVSSTKTAVGEPLTRLVECFRRSGLVRAKTQFYVVIDQYEELASIRTPDGTKGDFRSVVNRALSHRDATISYRVGTRGYGWRNHLNIFGTDSQLERDRDFKLVEIDVKLRRQEDKSPDIFPSFAEDVFARRLRYAARQEGRRPHDAQVVDMFGHSLAPSEEAKLIARDNADRILTFEPSWPEQVRDFLRRRARKDPLSGRLGEAWVRQKGWADERFYEEPPWERKGAAYWKKERIEVALLQIAGACKQRTILSGRGDILGLSGGNILFFLSICQAVWDFASQAADDETGQPEVPIRYALQTIGVVNCARGWLDNFSTDYGRSQDRFRLVQKLGETFSVRLLQDRKMSNPGHNGVSLAIDELLSRPDIYSIMIEAVDYGNLIMVEHANRNKDRRRRLKFYLNPLYCPVYKIPYQRSKEPFYVSVEELEDWLADAGIVPLPDRPKIRRRPVKGIETPLFDRLDAHLK